MDSEFKKVEKFAKLLIEIHGCATNTKSGFSCLIPDGTTSHYSKEGLLLWVFSNYHQRFETKFERYGTLERTRRMYDKFGIPESEYRKKIITAVKGYIGLLDEIECFKKKGFKRIGSGLYLFDELIWNYAASFDFLSKNPHYLREIEKVTIQNPIVEFAESIGDFEVKDKNRSAWDEVY